MSRADGFRGAGEAVRKTGEKPVLGGPSLTRIKNGSMSLESMRESHREKRSEMRGVFFSSGVPKLRNEGVGLSDPIPTRSSF